MPEAAGTVTVVRPPWDVPVRLVPLPSPPIEGRERVVRVDPGVALPGIAALEVVTVARSDRAGALLTHVRPIRGDRTTIDRRGGTDVAGTLAELLAELAEDGPERGPAHGVVAVGVGGTAFVRDVLSALTRVPLGARRTYAELAADAGRPRAVRAVASVMARNRVPLVLPCHRIVPTGGGTGRYGWGGDVKVALLDAEARATGRSA